MAGSFLHTFVVTDIASGWTECLPLVAREQHLVVEAMDVLAVRLPMKVLGLDTDNDSAFMNETLFDYCKERGIEQTRSRAYRKNDQAWVEQKNGAVVRRMVGYDRLSGIAAAQRLARVLNVARLLVNYFQPSYKLRKKTRVGAKVKKEYYPPATPCDRLLADPRMSPDAKARLRKQRRRLDPVTLLKELREAQSRLAALRTEPPDDSEPIGLDQFLSALPRLWEQGEVRPTHKSRETQPRHWRTRPDDFAPVWAKVEVWLTESPDETAKLLLDRLIEEHPGEFRREQLRTLQRRVAEWRKAKAAALLSFSETVIGAAPPDLSGAPPPDPRGFSHEDTRMGACPTASLSPPAGG